MTISIILKEELEKTHDIKSDIVNILMGKDVHKMRLYLTSLTKRIIESEIEFSRSKVLKTKEDEVREQHPNSFVSWQYDSPQEMAKDSLKIGYNQALKNIISQLESELKLIEHDDQTI